MKRCTGFLLISLFITFKLTSQHIEPKGIFLEDSTKTGFPVRYSLSVYHSPTTQILFPDSSYNYAPFELVKKAFFPTKTRDGKSFDSAIYVLRTFKLERSQQIALPVYIINQSDTTTVYADPASIGVKEYLSEIPPTIVLREQTDFFPVEKKFNYPYFLAWTGFILVLAIIVFFFFGKSIKKRYRLYIMRRDHSGFLNNFQKMEDRFSSLRDVSAIEQSLSIWKNYLTRLEHKPINTFTTTEISNLYQKEDLKNDLNIIDRAIYGGLISNESDQAINSLKKFSIRQYHKRKREVQNG